MAPGGPGWIPFGGLVAVVAGYVVVDYDADAEGERVPDSRRQLDLRLLVGGYAVSMTGNAVANVALILELKNSGAVWITALLIAELLPVVLMAPVAGSIVDKLESRSILVWAAVGQGCVALLLAFTRTPVVLVALMVVLNALAAVERPASSALVPHILGEDGATRAFARLAGGRSVGWVVGPALGGLLTSVGGSRLALSADAASFVVLAIMALMITARRLPSDGEDLDRGAGNDDSATAGLRLIWSDRVLRVALGTTALAAGIAIADNVSTPYKFSVGLGAGSWGFGIYLTVWALSSLVGTQILAFKYSSGREESMLGLGNALMGFGILGIGVAWLFPLALAMAVIGGIGNGMSSAGEGAVIRVRTPEALRGRAFAASGAVIQFASAFGAIAGAPSVVLLGASATLVACGSIAACAGLLGLGAALRRDEVPGATRARVESLADQV